MLAAIAFETLAGWLLGRAEELLAQWLPNGKRMGREWCVGDLAGERGQSLRVNLDSGRWGDFATGQKGGDFIALWAAMHQLTQMQAAKALAEKYGYGELDTSVVPLRAAVSDLEPEGGFEIPPADVSLTPHDFTHRQHGLPSHVHVYRAADRHPLMVVARYEGAHGKTFVPWTWREGTWRMKTAPRPRPLYGQDRLETHAGPTFVVEGEKAADALQSISQRASVVSWPGGANSWKHTDWSILRGRSCILWPDADPPGFAAMQGIAGLLIQLECPLQMIDTDGLPDGYDAADLVQQDGALTTVGPWIKARLKPVVLSEPPPQRVLAPKTIHPAVTVTPRGERIPEAESEPPAYAVAARYGLSFSKQGVHPNLANARALIHGRIAEGDLDPLYYDDFLQKTVTGTGDFKTLREWADHDTLALTDQLQRSFGIVALRKGTVEDAVNLYAYQHRRNSAQEWLYSLHHDGKKRLDHLFTQGFGAEKNEYTRSTAKCFLIGMVARVLCPGAQVDTLPVLEGSQGIQKTSALRALGGDFHAECQESATGKDFYLVLAGKMLVEIAELTSFRRVDIERINGVITCLKDRFRAPYERRASDHPRSCVFAATTNRDDWNRDDTGARRFWPIACTKIDLDWIKENREQLFAEAVMRYQAGESWWNVPVEMAKAEQNQRREDDVVATTLREYCQFNPEVNIADVMRYHMGLNPGQFYDRPLQQRVTSTLRSWGYLSKVVKDEGGKCVRLWVKPGTVSQSEGAEEAF